jgi:hypothetical protein
MVEDFAEAASYSALGNAILPGRLNTRALRVQTCGHQDGDHIAIKLRVVVQDGIAVRTSLWKCFPRLVAPPARRLDDECRVMLKCNTLQRPCSITKKQYSSLNVNLGTVKKSNATITSRWLARKASQRLPGSPRRCTRRRYRAIVRSETEKPSFSSSPWIFGAPQSEFSAAMRWMRLRISSLILGRPPRGWGFHRQYRGDADRPQFSASQ